MILSRASLFMKMIACVVAVIMLLTVCGQLDIKWTRNFDVLGPGYYRINCLSSTKDAVYLTGTFKAQNMRSRCFTASYDRDGSRKWYSILDVPDIEQTEGNWIVALSTQEELVTSRTDIYMLAQARDGQNQERVILVKFDTLGTIEWQKTITTHNGPLTSVLLSDYAGNLYVAGWERDKANQSTMYIGKYDESGKSSWFSKYYNEQLIYDDLKYDIMQPGYLVAAGLIKNTGEIFYMRCDAQGQIQGPFKYSPQGKPNKFSDVKVDAEGKVYLSGTISNIESGDDFLIITYSAGNDLLWAKQYDGPAHRNDVAKALAIDESLGVCITGSSESAQGTLAISTVRYDRDGNLSWVATQQDKAAEPIIMIPSHAQADRKLEARHLIIAGTSENDALAMRLNNRGFYTLIKLHSKAARKTIPTALSASYVALQSVHEEGADALIVNYGPPSILGITRWD